MGGSKQGLIIGFFGPPIPPRRRSSGCCGCRWLCCSLFKILLFIVFLLGIVVLIMWLALRPHQGRIFVEKATLEEFNLNNGSLIYKLSTEISIRNPNERISLHYDYIEGIAYYGDSRLGNTTLSSFDQGHKNTTKIYPVFRGQAPVIGKDLVSIFDQEQKKGFFNIRVDIQAEAQYKVFFVKSKKYHPRVECKLRMPAPRSKSPFELTQCDVDLF